MLQDRKAYQICLFIMVNIGMNYIGKVLALHCNLPVWFDSIGTVFTAYTMGPVCGAMVGASVNLIYGLLYSYTHIVYAIVSISVGIVVGLCAKRGQMESLFGVLSTAFFVTVISVILSTPLNYYFFGGKTGNEWGDGIIALFMRMGLPSVLSHCAGEFYIDFLDKTISLLLLFGVIHTFRRLRDGKRKKRKKQVFFWVFLFAGVACMGSRVMAAKNETTDNYNAYVQTIYNGENGLPGGTANAIAQTNDGILWIGTYGGLYRYNGNTFKWMDQMESVRNVNCLYTDEEGRLWIGTNDSGLSICINEEISNVVTSEDGLTSDSVRCITQGADGKYYVGTTGSLAVLDLSGGLRVERTIPEIVYAKDICVDENGNMVVITDDGTLYLVRGEKIVARKQGAVSDGYNCCVFDAAGSLYVGTTGNRLVRYAVQGEKLRQEEEIECEGLSNLNSIHIEEDGRIFICADNGVGYLDTEKNYQVIHTNTFNSSIDRMLVDYQGNLWFTSSRLGLLRLCRSVFTDLYHEAGLADKVVNAVICWKDSLYFGTDNGLDMVDAETYVPKENALTKQLQGVRIRSFMEDKRGHLWICTSGSGLYEMTPGGKIRKYDAADGLNGAKLRTVVELSDGAILAAGDSGLNYIENGKVTEGIGYAQGLENTKVLCTLELSDGSVLAGTDGGGIARIRDRKIETVYGKKDGLSAEVILKLIKDQDGDGIFVVTSNAICYMEGNGAIRVLDQFPYYNNYDVIQGNNGTLFVLSSAGIYVVDRKELLEGEKLEYVLLDSKAGLQKALTPNAWNYEADDDTIFLSTDSGVICMDMNHYGNVVRSYRMLVNSIRVDGTAYPVERGQTTYLPSGSERIEIVPEVINYSLNMPYVSVYLEGYDAEPKIMQQSELSNLVYTNLPVGTYTFHLAVLDHKGKNVIAECAYTIEKESEIYDHWWFIFYAVLVFAVAVAYLTWLFFRTQIQRTLNMQKKELEFARNQIEMGNETVLTIARTVDAKDENTSQHSVRVSEYSVMIAKRLGYDDAQCEDLRKTALLHDIGKIGIPDRVLNKAGRLTDEEYAIMKSHVVKGAEILKKFTLIKNVQEGALYHHERYDGRGYVHGLKGEEIPLNARIIGIADAFDAMTANRVYRKKLDFAYVLEELRKGRGTQFDPKLVDIMLDLIDSGAIQVEQLYQDEKEGE